MASIYLLRFAGTSTSTSEPCDETTTSESVNMLLWFHIMFALTKSKHQASTGISAATLGWTHHQRAELATQSTQDLTEPLQEDVTPLHHLHCSKKKVQRDLSHSHMNWRNCFTSVCVDACVSHHLLRFRGLFTYCQSVSWPVTRQTISNSDTGWLKRVKTDGEKQL